MRTTPKEFFEWIKLFGHLAGPIIALGLGGIGIAIRKWRENVGGNWPTTEGQVQFVNVRLEEGRNHLKHAVITYSYFLNQYESGEYVRAFLKEQSAWDFANALKGKRVQVHYNPVKPAVSTLRAEELEQLLPVKSENSFARQ
jgi:hypothetical protein